MPSSSPARSSARRKPAALDLTWPPPGVPDDDPQLVRVNSASTRVARELAALAFARAVVFALQLSPGTRFDRTLRASARYAQARLDRHLPVDITALTHTELEHAALSVWKDCSEHTRQNEISCLRVAFRQLNPMGGWPVEAPARRRRAVPAPYTDVEQARLMHTARHLRLRRRRAEFTALLALTCGAGLTSVQVLALTWDDVLFAPAAHDPALDDGSCLDAHDRVVNGLGSLWVRVDGQLRPVRGRYQEPLAWAKDFARENGYADPIVKRGKRPLDRLGVAALRQGLDGFSTRRATNTFRAWALSRLPLPLVATMSGLSGSHVASLVQHVDPDEVPGWESYLAVFEDDRPLVSGLAAGHDDLDAHRDEDDLDVDEDDHEELEQDVEEDVDDEEQAEHEVVGEPRGRA